MFAEQAYLFRHAVLRDAAYTLLVPSDRASMHRLVVEIVERVYGDRLADDLAPELATHCRIAREDDADDKLLEKERHYAEIAQNLAFTGYEYAQAISWSNRLAEIATDAARPEVLLRFARSLVLGGRRDEAWEVLERIYAIATNEEHPDVLAWTNMVKVGLLRGDGRMGEAQELADSVIADAERWKPGTRAAVFGSYTLLLQGAGRAAEAETYRKLALEAASQDDVKKTEVRLLLNSIGPLRSSGRVDEAEAMAERALAMAREIKDAGAEAATLANLANLRSQQGRPEDAREMRKQALELARRVGDRQGESLHLAHMAEQDHEEGLSAQAEALCTRAAEVAREIADARTEGFALTTMAGVMLDTGRFDKAGPLLDRAIELERLGADRLREGIALCMRAALRVATGDVASARQDWQEGVRHMHATNSQVPLETARRRFVTACEAAGVSLPPDDE